MVSGESRNGVNYDARSIVHRLAWEVSAINSTKEIIKIKTKCLTMQKLLQF